MLCTFSYARLKLNPARVYFRMKTFHVNSIYLAFTFLMNLVFIQLSVDQIFYALHISCCSSLCVLALSVQLLTFTFFLFIFRSLFAWSTVAISIKICICISCKAGQNLTIFFFCVCFCSCDPYRGFVTLSAQRRGRATNFRQFRSELIFNAVKLLSNVAYIWAWAKLCHLT